MPARLLTISRSRSTLIIVKIAGENEIHEPFGQPVH
jgi:hypothetical protein